MKIDFISNNKKGITPIVATSLLLLISVVAFLGLQNFFTTQQSSLVTGAQVGFISKDLVKIEFLESDKLFVRNKNSINFTFNSVSVGGVDCGISGSIEPTDIGSINLGDCLDGMSTGQKEIIVTSDTGIFKNYLMLNSGYDNSLTVSFTNVACGAGEVRIFGLEGISNSHSELFSESNYNYNLCLKHTMYSLGTSCSGDYTRLYYVDGSSDAHGYTTNTSPYESEWYEVCLNANGATSISSTVAVSSPTSESVCVGSFETINNVNGAHLGDCNAYSTKVWVDIE